MIRIFIFIYLMLTSVFLLAQQKVIAYFDFKPSLNLESIQYERICRHLLTMEQISFQQYETNGATSGYWDTLRSERAAHYLLKANYTTYSDLPAEFKYILDSNGTMTSAYYAINHWSTYSIQLTDIATGEIVYFNHNSYIYPKPNIFANERPSHYKVPTLDATKYVGKKPQVLQKTNPKAYKEGLQRMNEAYELQINEYKAAKLEDNISNFLEELSNLNDRLFEEIIPVKDYSLEKNKLVHASLTTNITIPKKRTQLQLFSLDTIQNYIFPTIYGWWTYNDLPEPHISKYALLSKRKEAADALLNGKQLYCTEKDLIPTKILGNDKKISYIAIDAELSNLQKIASSLSASQTIKLLDRKNENQLNVLRKRFKGESFIDDNFSLQILGADLVMRLNDKTIEILDVRNDEVLKRFPVGDGPNGLFDILGDLLDIPIKIAYISEQKKGKVSKVMVYNPFGFEGSSHRSLIIYHKTMEEVDGESLSRYREVGQVFIDARKIIAMDLAEGKVSKEVDELLNLIQNNEELILKSKDFKLLGSTLKL